MADIPRLNGMIKCFEEGKPAMGAFCTPDVDAALAASQAKYDSIIFEMEHNIWDIRALRDCLQYMLNRKQIVEQGLGGAERHAARPHSGERQREKPIPRQAGARYRRLRHHLAACRHGRPGLQRRRRLPLSAPQDGAALRADRHPRRFARHGGALLGHQQPGVLQEGRRVAARPERRNPRRSDDRGRRGGRRISMPC